MMVPKNPFFSGYIEERALEMLALKMREKGLGFRVLGFGV